MSSNVSELHAKSPAGEYLAFTLGQEEYGIDIQKVSEIRSYETPTRIANAPAFVKGVVNLRGIIVPIVDMRIKFNLGTPSYDQFTVVIILNIGHRVVGMVVDRVSDVTTLMPEQIKPAPEIGSALNTDQHRRPRHAGRTYADPGRYRQADVQRRYGLDRKHRAGGLTGGAA